MLSLLPALAFMVAVQDEPPRHFLGETPFSFEFRGELKQVRSEELSRPNDWLIKATDWEVDGEDIYLAASHFEGKPDTKMDRDFLKKAALEFAEGMESETDKSQMISNEYVMIDERPAQRASYSIGKGDGAMYVQSIFLASGTNLYSLIAVYFEESGKSADAAKRALDSVRFKRPLDQPSGIIR